MTPLQHRDEDPLGLEAWAAASSLGPPEALAMISTYLTGLTGGTATLRLGSSDHEVNSGLFICDADSVASRLAHAAMLGQTLKRQEALIARSKQFDQGEAVEAYHGGGLFSPNHDELQRLGNRSNALEGTSDLGMDLSLDRESVSSDRQIHLENLLRPKVVVTGVLPGNLVDTARRYNRGKMVAGGAVLKLPGSSRQKHQRLDELVTIATGAEVLHRLTPKTPAIPATVRLNGTVALAASDMEWVLRERPDLFKVSTPLWHRPTTDSHDVDYDAVDWFQHRLDRVATHLLARRRGQAESSVGFHTEAATSAFRSCQRSFMLQMASEPVSELPAMITLPMTMAWTLIALAGQADLDAYTVESSFNFAREIGDRAVGLLQRAQRAAQVEEHLRSARKVVERLRRAGPCKRRVLVRGFDRQSLAVHEPILRSLIDAGVITESHDGVLTLGPNPVSSLSAVHLSNNP